MNSGRLTRITPMLKWTRNILLCQCFSTVVVFKIWISVAINVMYEPALIGHVMLSTLGIMPFLSQAVLIWFSNNNMYSPQTLKGNKYRILHGILTSVASGLVIAGIIFEIYRSKFKYNVHYSTLHFILIHCVTGVIFAILIISALFCYLFTLICKKLNPSVACVYFESIHNLLIQFAYMVGILCLCTGYNTRRFKFYSPKGIPSILTIMTIIEVIWPLSLVLKSLYQNIKCVTSFTKSTSQELNVF